MAHYLNEEITIFPNRTLKIFKSVYNEQYYIYRIEISNINSINISAKLVMYIEKFINIMKILLLKYLSKIENIILKDNAVNYETVTFSIQNNTFNIICEDSWFDLKDVIISTNIDKSAAFRLVNIIDHIQLKYYQFWSE